MAMRARQKGLTLIELVVVMLIITILVAVSIPLMRGRVNSAKWAEGKAFMGTIAKALRAYVATTGEDFKAVPTLSDLGFSSGGLTGSYFTSGGSGNGNFTWVIHDDDPIEYTITATAPSGIKDPSSLVLDQTGVFTEK